MSIGPLTFFGSAFAGRKVIVSVQNPLPAQQTIRNRNLMWFCLKPRSDHYAGKRPFAGDAFLVVEVSRVHDRSDTVATSNCPVMPRQEYLKSGSSISIRNGFSSFASRWVMFATTSLTLGPGGFRLGCSFPGRHFFQGWRKSSFLPPLRIESTSPVAGSAHQVCRMQVGIHMPRSACGRRSTVHASKGSDRTLFRG